MFCIGKNGILSPSQILSTSHNFQGPEYLYRLFDVLRKQTTCEMKTIEVQRLHSAMIS